jgi:hypothetical protein
MEVEEHFAFKATCEHEDDKKYNVYPTCEGATFRKDKDEDSDYDSDEEMPSLYDSEADNNEHPYSNQGIYYDSDDDENMTVSIVRALLQYIDSRIAMAEPMETPLFYEDSSEIDPTTRTLLNPETQTTNIVKEDTILQPKTNDDPNLTVTFSDEEDDEASKVPPIQQHDILPVPKIKLEFGL